jgi:hypothetical protein
MAKKKNSAEVIPATDTKTFKKVADAQKHAAAFFNSLSGDENFTAEIFTTPEGIQFTGSVQGKK